LQLRHLFKLSYLLKKVIGVGNWSDANNGSIRVQKRHGRKSNDNTHEHTHTRTQKHSHKHFTHKQGDRWKDARRRAGLMTNQWHIQG